MTGRRAGHAVQPPRVRWVDSLALGVLGVRTRPTRAVLTAAGIGIGVAALVSVFGISSTGRARLLAEIDRLGTDVLEIAPGQHLAGGRAPLPDTAPAMLRRIAGVEDVAMVAALDQTVRRTDMVGMHLTGGIAVAAADPDLLAATHSRLRSGRFLDAGTERLPVVVLGAVAARRLAVEDAGMGPLVWLGDRWFTVGGILEPNPIADVLDRTALVGVSIARELFDPDLTPTTIYLRTTPGAVEHVRSVAAATAKPAAPSEVRVLRPADALLARAAAETALDTLGLGLGAVTVAVGAIGVANIMIIAVLERRHEIGLRRALGATGRQVGTQFLLEATALGLAGGLAGVVAGTAVTAGYGLASGSPPSLSPGPLLGGVGVAVLVAAAAGIHPARRAARLAPAEALRAG